MCLSPVVHLDHMYWHFQLCPESNGSKFTEQHWVGLSTCRNPRCIFPFPSFLPSKPYPDFRTQFNFSFLCKIFSSLLLFSISTVIIFHVTCQFAVVAGLFTTWFSSQEYISSGWSPPKVFFYKHHGLQLLPILCPVWFRYAKRTMQTSSRMSRLY